MQAKREKEIEKIKPEKEHKEHKEIEKIQHEKLKFEKEFQLDKHKVEFEKIFPEHPKSLVEGGQKFFEGGDPFRPNLPGGGGLQGVSGGGPIESRMSQLEATVAQLSTFITQGMRPDLGAGALTNEPDQKPAPKPEPKPGPKPRPKGKKPG